jgi:hypothetical protein
MRILTRPITLLGLALLFGTLGVPGALAEPSFFTSDCAGCHNNDTATCNGCHHHRGTLSATADAAQYDPGAPVTITLHGGNQHGWVRGLLYNESNVEIARRTGPHGNGDDSQPGAVTFPVQFNVTAPATAGTYTWQAAWFGNTGDGGSVHGENRTAVVIHVVDPTADVPTQEPGLLRRTWGQIKGVFRR